MATFDRLLIGLDHAMFKMPLKRIRAPLLVLPVLMLLLAPQPALAQGFLDTLLATMAAQTDTWLQRGVEVALTIFVALAVIEFAWHGIQTVLKNGELSDLFGGLVLKVTALGFFYTVIVFAPSWIPLIPDTFEAAGQRISGLPADQLTPSGLINQGIDVSSRIFNAPLQSHGIMEVGRNILSAFLVGLVVLLVFAAFAIIAIQLLVVKIEMLMVISAGIVMLAMSGSRWTMAFAEKYLGYAVSVGARMIIIAILAGFGVTFGNSIVASLTADGSALHIPQLFSLLGTAAIFSVMSFMIPSLAGSFLSGAVSMSLSNTAAAGGSMASMAGSGVGGVASLASGAAGAALGAVARLATPTAAVGSIAGAASGGAGSLASGAGSIGGDGSRSAFSGSGSPAGSMGGSGRAGGGAGPGGGAGGFGAASGGAGTGAGSGAGDTGGAAFGGGSGGGGGGAGGRGFGVAGGTGSGGGDTGGVAFGGGSGSGGTGGGGSGGSGSGGSGAPAYSAPAYSSSSAPMDSGSQSGQTAGFANPNAGAPSGSGNQSDGYGGGGAGRGRQSEPMDYRDEERLAEKNYRARASASPLSRAMLKASDRLKDASDKSSAFARRQRRPLASDGHTGGSPTIRLGMSGD